MSKKKYLFLTEVAREARVSVSTVRHWIDTGKLRSSRPGRRRLVLRSDLDDFLSCSEGQRSKARRGKRW